MEMVVSVAVPYLQHCAVAQLKPVIVFDAVVKVVQLKFVR